MSSARAAASSWSSRRSPGAARLFYRLLHHEPVRTSADPLMEGRPDPDRDPYRSNQAIPTLLATRDRERFHRLFPALRIERVEWFSLAVYPLSGGFKPWSLIGEARRPPPAARRARDRAGGGPRRGISNAADH